MSKRVFANGRYIGEVDDIGRYFDAMGNYVGEVDELGRFYNYTERILSGEADDEFKYSCSFTNTQALVSVDPPVAFFMVKPCLQGVGQGTSNRVKCVKTPSALQNLSAKRRDDNTGILLQWVPCRCDGYVISRRVSSEYKEIAWIDNKDINYYVDKDVEPEITYSYRVAAAFTLIDSVYDEEFERHSCGEFAEVMVEGEN